MFFRLLLAFIFYLVFINDSHTQNYFNTWYFGNGAGIKFGSQKTTRLSDNQMFTDESCVSVSDKTGQILFYTNGVKIWNNKHEVINEEKELHGNKSSAQIVVCLKPNTLNEYYIFTVDEKAGLKGLNYSVLKIGNETSNNVQKMKNDAYYTPDLLTKNIQYELSILNSKLTGPVSEKITSVFHKNGKDIWIIGHTWNSNTFIAYLLTENGITNKVESNAGIYYKNESRNDGSEAIGYLKPSHDGTKLAVTTCYRENSPIELFNFDSETGKITWLKNYTSVGKAYGIEFSPDNSKLYVSYLEGPMSVAQIDLSSGSDKPIQIFKKTDQSIFYGAIQLGPDNKIYIAKTYNFLDIIEKPNLSGASCLYKESALSLGNTYSVYGLPSKPSIGKFDSNISSQTQNNAETQNHKPASIDVSKKSDCSVLLKDTTLNCVGSLVLKPGGVNVTYEWSTKEKTNTIVVKESNYYSVTLTGDGCKETKKIYVKFNARPTFFSTLNKFSLSASYNNYFAYTINDVKDFYLKVSTNSGKLVFETKDPKVQWKGTDLNGKQVKPGVYNWDLQYTTICGSKIEQKSGQVTVEK